MPDAPDATPTPDEFELLLDHLRHTRGVDLGGYKRAGLVRRVSKRMRAVQIPTFAAYVAYLDAHDDELARLLNTILINVTAFFRDELPWEYMRTEVVPRLLEEREAGEPLRVWSRRVRDRRGDVQPRDRARGGAGRWSSSASA